MTIGIIGAMDEEIAYLKEHIQHTKETHVAGSLFIKGELYGKSIVLVKSGIGKVNAAMTTTILMERYQPTAIINTGTAGGFAEQLSVGDLVIGSKIVYHDVDVTGFNYEYGQVPGLPPAFIADSTLIQCTEKAVGELHIGYKIGLIATGDSFMDDPVRINHVRDKFKDMIALEMEGASIAQVCHQYHVPFVVIRALSDIAGKESPITFDRFIKIAANNAAKLIMNIIKEYHN